MTKECNCLPLKQILSCPFKTSENTRFFSKFLGCQPQRLTGRHWSQQESWGVSVLGSQALPSSAWREIICFRSHILLSTQDFVPAELGDAMCYPVLPGGLSMIEAEGSFPGVPGIPQVKCLAW